MRLWTAIAVLALGCLSTPAQRFMRSINTLEELVTSNPNNVHTNVYVAGRTARGDGFEGLFTYDASSVVATNLGTVFKPVNYTGRWIRNHTPGEYQLQWFIADDSGVAAAFTSAVNTVGLAGGGSIKLPEGVISLDAGVKLPAYGSIIEICGSRRLASVINYVGDEDAAFETTGSLDSSAFQTAGGYRFKDFTLLTPELGSSVDGIVVNNIASRELSLENVRIMGFRNGRGLVIGQSHTVTLDRLHFQNNKVAFEFGGAGFINSLDMRRVDLEDNRDTNYVAKILNGINVNWKWGVIENNTGAILVSNVIGGKFSNLYHEANTHLWEWHLQEHVGVKFEDCTFLKNSLASSVAIVVGKKHANYNDGIKVEDCVFQGPEIAVMAGDGGAEGATMPILEDCEFHNPNTKTNLFFRQTLQQGPAVVRNQGITKFYTAAGAEYLTLGGSTNVVTTSIHATSGQVGRDLVINRAADFSVSPSADHLMAFGSSAIPLMITRSGSSVNGGGIYLQKSRNNINNPSIALDGDVMDIEARAYSAVGGAYVAAAQIRFEIDGSLDDSGFPNDVPGSIHFATRLDHPGVGHPNPNLTNRFTIAHNGVLSVKVGSKLAFNAADAQAISAGETIVATGTKVLVVGDGAARTAGDPAIEDGAEDGQIIYLVGTDDANTVTINDGSNIIAPSNRTLGAGDVWHGIWDDDLSAWLEVSFSDN